MSADTVEDDMVEAEACPGCGTPMPVGTHFCGNCGRALGLQPALAPSPSPSPVPGGRWRPVLAVVALGVAVAGVAALVTVALLGGGSGEVTTVALVPAFEAGPDPFVASVSLEPVPVSVPRIDPPPGRGAEGALVLAATSGGTPGLYQATAGQPTCDTDLLVRTLTDSPAVAAAWAGAMGVEVDEISETVASFAPVALSADVAVTNHALRDGAAEPFAAVLQAGTAVLVDPTGVPRVRCSCGNPLRPPRLDGEVRTEGAEWAGFEASQVRSIEAASEPMPALAVVDPASGEEVSVAVGGGGQDHGLLVAHSGGVSVLAPDGSQTLVLDQLVQWVDDDGSGGLVYTPDYDGDVPPATWGSVRWLPGGATETQELIAAPDPPHRRVGLNGVVEVDGHHLLAYSETDSSNPQQPVGTLWFLDLDDPTAPPVSGGDAGSIGPEHGPGPVSASGDRVLVPWSTAVGRGWSVLDGDLASVVAGPPAGWEDSSCEVEPFLCSQMMALTGDGSIVALGSTEDGVDSVVVIDATSGEVRTEVPLGFTHPGFVALDARDQEAVVSFVDYRWSDAVPTARRIDLVTGELEDLGVRGLVRYLSAPLLVSALVSTPPPSTSSTASTSTTADPGAQVDALIDRWTDLNLACRGGSGNDDATWEACDARSVVGRELEALGWCYGREGEFSYMHQWHQCGPGSLRSG